VACPAALTPLLPEERTAWLFARPRAIYDHPRLGPLVARTFDDAGERALIRRAERTGYDVRTLDRAAIAWTPRGAVYLAAGPLDGHHIAELLWDQLLPPRQRGTDRGGNQRLEGTLARAFVALLVAPACGVAAFAEGEGETAAVDRVFARRADVRDPGALLVWHTAQVPTEFDRATRSALARFVRAVDVRVDARNDGVAVELDLEGPLPDDVAERVRGALLAVIDSPLGELANAAEWLAPDRVAMRRAGRTFSLAALVPWRHLAALADALRGEVGRSPAP
jgi:hypothetical protein